MFDGFLNADSNLFLLIGALIVGLIAIIIGGDKFVDSAIWIAVKTKMPKMLIGATLVAIGTTLPEMFASFTAASQGNTSIAIGNALGSIMCNTSLILALTLTACPSKVNRKHFFPKFALLLLSIILVLVFAISGLVELWQCIILLALTVAYIAYNIVDAKKQSRLNNELQQQDSGQDNEYQKYIDKKSWVMILLFFVGAVAIAIGANLLVSSVKGFCGKLGISEGIIALTVVAIGTSLPELVTALTSIKKNSAEISLGNIIGANIINATLLVGGSGIFTNGLLIPSADYMTTIVTIVAIVGVLTLIGLPIFIKGKTYRYQGIIMLCVYAAYIAFLIYRLMAH